MHDIGTPPAPLTPEERRELIERPFPTVRVIGGARPWGGTSTVNWFTDARTRAYTPNTQEQFQWQQIANVSDN